jgi:hypothetical protein
MPPSEVNRRPAVRWYWWAWGIATALFLTFRFTVLIGLDKRDRTAIGFAYPMACHFMLLMLGRREGVELMSHLKQKHPAKWAELTSGPGFGPGGRNGFRSFPWLFSYNDPIDPVLAELKSQSRRHLLFVGVVFLSYIPVTWAWNR